MKVAQIKKLVMERKHCVILTSNMKTQWIGGSGWIARVDDGLNITEDGLKGMFDLDEQKEKLQVQELPLETYPIWPVARRDLNVMKPAELDIGNYGGVVVLTYQNAVYLVEKKYVKAMVTNNDYREYMLGWDEGNNPVILVNDGVIMAGIVRPMMVDDCAAFMQKLYEVCNAHMIAGGTHAAENNGPLKLEAETGIQIDMEDFNDGGTGG